MYFEFGVILYISDQVVELWLHGTKTETTVLFLNSLFSVYITLLILSYPSFFSSMENKYNLVFPQIYNFMCFNMPLITYKDRRQTKESKEDEVLSLKVN